MVVRSILFEPDWLLLDEATASLDESAEHMVYRLLRERLPRTTIVSVGHRSTLQALHDRSIDIGNARKAARSATVIDEEKWAVLNQFH